MFKKIFAIATLLCVIPMMASAATKWTLGTRAMSQGGTISSRNMTNQVVANGGIFKQYTTATNSTVTVTVATGYKISKLSNNGLISVPANPYTFTPDGSGNVSIQATFARIAYTLNAMAGSNGSVNKQIYTPVYLGTQSPAKTFIFAPNPGYKVSAISAPAGLGTNYQYVNAVTGDVISSLPAGDGVKVKVNVVNVPANMTFSATFAAVNPPVVIPTTPGANCANCHAAQGVGVGNYEAFAPGPHNNKYNCAGCHVGANTGGHPGVIVDCNSCHGSVVIAPTTAGTYDAYSAAHRLANTAAYASIAKCGVCHAPASDDPTSPHAQGGCVSCHSIVQTNGLVNDNSGVRAVSTEFGKWSHHVTGVTLNDVHCAVCHLEGKLSADGNAIVIDRTKHRADNAVHLRNADNDTDFAWNPNAPDFSGMDNYCMACHDANGATSPVSLTIQAFINDVGLAAPGKIASPTNPFGDTISNQYDKLERPAVVDASGQFTTANNSHHAVKGKRYTGRSRTEKGGTIAAFASNSSATMPGVRSTIYDAGKFEATYTTLANANTIETGLRNGGTKLGDDSTLHCADCHTVGQFAARGSVAFQNMSNAFGAGITRYYKNAIGAHGSNNEYLLRNNLGTDEKHTGAKFAGSGSFGADVGLGNLPYLVCYNCHAFSTYGSAFGTNGGGHAAEYDVEGRCNGAGQTINTTYGNMTGETRLKTFNTDATNYGKVTGDTFGNIFGIECNNCHNSGVAGNMFGGIHGSKQQTYTDGMGNTSKHFRFLPGLGNTMFVPGTKGGITGGTVAVYKNYSGNRNGTGTGSTVGQTFTLSPVRDIRITGVDNGNGSYNYITGGVNNDLNWEQKTAQSIGGQTSLSAKAMGCYTLTPNGTPKISNTVAKGYPADDIRYAATEGQLGPDGRELFDTWGGCDDHNGAQGAGTSPTRKVLRKVNY